jgi:hypothetical protein
MHNYIVIFSSTADANEAEVLRIFPEHHFEIVGGLVWAVASEKRTPSDVCRLLGIETDTKRAGVVVRADAFNGYFNRALWEKLNEWASDDV